MFWRKARNDSDTEGFSFGRYRVVSMLGEGAMATVYLADDPVLNRKVAVKVIHPHLASINLWARFRTEAKTAASLRSPNIVEVFDYGTQNERQYLVLEYIDGPSLHSVLNARDGHPLEARDCAAIICQAAEGLAIAEKHGVVHRDVKPANMMFTTEGVLKIADFGLAHINEQNLTMTGSLLGSPGYMSPEQIEGGPPTSQTDMFSLGVVLYCCLCGCRPFASTNMAGLMRDICDLPHLPVLEVVPAAAPELASLAEILLHKKPVERGGGARWLALQLRTFLGQNGVFDPAGHCRELLSTMK